MVIVLWLHLPLHKLAVFSSVTVFQSPYSVTSSLRAIRQRASSVHLYIPAGGHTHACMRDPNMCIRKREETKSGTSCKRAKMQRMRMGMGMGPGSEAATGCACGFVSCDKRDRKMRDNWSVNWWVGNNNWCHFKVAKWWGLKESAQGKHDFSLRQHNGVDGCCWWYPNLRWYFTSTFLQSAELKSAFAGS